MVPLFSKCGESELGGRLILRDSILRTVGLGFTVRHTGWSLVGPGQWAARSSPLQGRWAERSGGLGLISEKGPSAAMNGGTSKKYQN